MVTIAALGVEPAALGESFEKCGFTATVLTNEKSDLAPKR